MPADRVDDALELGVERRDEGEAVARRRMREHEAARMQQQPRDRPWLVSPIR